MLRPRYIEQLPDNLVELYSQAERDIIVDMVRRITTYDFFIPSAEYQFKKLQDMGLLHNEIIRLLSKSSGISEKEIKRLMKEAGAIALKSDDSIYRKAGLDPTPLDASPALQAVMASGIEKTSGLFKNLTSTTANTATKQFERALDRAYMQITSGAFDYNGSIRMAIKDLAGKGIAAVEYPTGHVDYIETAVRRAVVTGVNQTTGVLQEQRADEMDSDLVETTAHAGARDTGSGPANHASWQGKVYSRSGNHPKYPSLREKTGYGTGEGLKGWGCRHDFFPFIEGISEPGYSKAELAEMEEKKYIYNGKDMTEYEATQKQRAIERTIRKWKREEVAMKAADQPTDEATSKVRQWQGVQRDFIKQTGLKRQYDRERIEKVMKGRTDTDKLDIEKLKKSESPERGKPALTGETKEAIVYHGSNTKFEQFDYTKIGDKNQVDQYGSGFYFADTPEQARLYGDNVYAVKIKYSLDRRTAKRAGATKDYQYSEETGIWIIPYEKQDNIKILGTAKGDDINTGHKRFKKSRR